MRTETGTHGEMAWTGDAAARLAGELRIRGHDAISADAAGEDDVRAPADLLIALHYQRDSMRTRAFAGSPNPASGYVSAAAAASGAAWVALFDQGYSALSGIPVTPGVGGGANLIDYYLWCYVDKNTACAIVECGNADLDAAVLYEPGIAHVVSALATITERWGNGERPGPEPPIGSATPVLGLSLPTIGPIRLAAGAWRHNSRASFAIAQLYAGLAPIAGIRPEVAFAQAMHETGWLTFPRIARPEWHNYAGLGCDEVTRDCARFASDEEGVRAHLGHLLVYFGGHDPPFCDLDPRHDLVGHRHLPNDLAALGRHWAPAADYGTNIAAHELAEILATVRSD